MSTPRFSVIIPVYNRSAVVGRALDSVMQQTRADWEICVVDDGSTDRTREIVDDYCARDARIRCSHQCNEGAGSARNKAIEAATGEWIAFLDSDDWWSPTKLENAANVIDKSAAIELIHSAKKYIDKKGRELLGSKHKPSDMRDKNFLLSRFAMKTSSVLVKRSLLSNPDERFQTVKRTCEDYELFWRVIIRAKAIGYVVTPDAYISITRDSLSRAGDESQLVIDNLHAISQVARWSRQRGYDATYTDILEQFKFRQYRKLLILYCRRLSIIALIKVVFRDEWELAWYTKVRAFAYALAYSIKARLR